MKNYESVQKPDLDFYNHIYLITHDDLDGAGCEIVTTSIFKNCYFSIYHYGYNSVDSAIKTLLPKIEKDKTKGEEVYLIIADVCLNSTSIELLNESYHKGLDIIYIDHHKPSLDYADYEWTLVNNQCSATKMMYEFFVGRFFKEKALNSYLTLETFVNVVSDYDTWQWSENNDWNPVYLNDLFYQLGMDLFVYNLFDKIKQDNDVFINETEMLFLKKLVWNKRDIVFEEYNNRLSIYLENELKIGIVDDFSDFPDNHSLFGHYVLENNEIDLVILVNKSTSRISFRSKEFDVNEFAKQFNGGGHSQAAGCSFVDFIEYSSTLSRKHFIQQGVSNYHYIDKL